MTRMKRVRLHLAAWILGDGWLGVIMRYQLIVERARCCITPDGHVILADCAPLADALYADIPGEWTLSITRTDPSLAAAVTALGGP